MNMKSTRPIYQIPLAHELNFSSVMGACSSGAKVSKIGQGTKSGKGGKVSPMNMCIPQGSGPQTECLTGFLDNGNKEFCTGGSVVQHSACGNGTAP
jgi:hypothetical protein